MRPTSNQLSSLVLVPYAALASQLWFLCDDAYISFRYAHNAALGHGLRYNLGEHVPVEGYSNFLWTLLAAGVEAAQASPMLVMPAISALCGAGLVLHVLFAARRLGLSHIAAVSSALLLACSPIVGAWATGGLATMPAAWALFAMVERLVLSRGTNATVAACLAAVCLSLLRTEGPAWVIVAVVLGIAVRHQRAEERPWREPLTVLTAATAVIAVHMGWRYTTYGDVVSNTARAKVGMSGTRLLRGLTYVLGTWASLLTPALMLTAIPAAIRRWGAHGIAIALMAIAVPIWCVVIGGDYMTFGRLLLAGLPFAALAAGAGVDALLKRYNRGAVMAGVGAALLAGVLPAADVHLTPEVARDALFFRNTTPYVRSEAHMWRFMRGNARRWSVQGRALAQLPAGGSLVTGAIGARGYYSDVFFHDRGGLVTSGLTAKTGHNAKESPGHDIQAPREAFLPLEPTWLNFKLVSGMKPTKTLRKELKDFRATKAVRRNYGPVLYPVEISGTHHVLLMLERSDDAMALWDGWDATLDDLETKR